MNEENIVEIKDLRKSFDKGKVTALNGIDLEIKKGEFVSITGPSGSGKSTLLNMIGALDRRNSVYLVRRENMFDIKIKTTTTVDPDLKELADLYGIDLCEALEVGLDILLGIKSNH